MSRVERLIFFDPDAPCEDAIDGLLSRLGGDDSRWQPGCKIHRNSETGAIAVFPSVPFFPVGSTEQRKLESDWQVRALEMHSQQQPVPLPPDKPTEITHRYHPELTRGD